MKKTYQVVFLIDVSQGINTEEVDDLIGSRLSSIRLSTLKLLTYLSNQISPSSISKTFRWGCKFYNPITNFSEKIDFCEFDLKNFEDFENRLESVFEGEKKKQYDIVRRRRANAQLGYDNIERFGTPQENEEIDPGKCLKDNLTNILHDFQWDRPEITSPVRPSFQRRGSKRMSVPNEPMYHNFLWLLSDSPRTIEDIKKYTLCGVKCDSDSVFSYILPPMVYSQFYEQRRIRFFWLDLGSFPQSRCSAVPGVASMHGALIRVQGGVVPLSALLQLTSVHRGAATQPSYCPAQLLLPLSVIMRYYATGQLQPVSENDPTPQATTVQLKGLPGSESVDLLLSPLSVDSSVQSRNHAPSDTDAYWLELGSSGENCAERISLKTSPAKEMKRRSAVHHPADQVFSVGGRDLHCQGLLRAGEVPLQMMRAEMSYLVTVDYEEHGSPAPVSFSSLLQVLAGQNLVLVVSLQHPLSAAHLLGVLRPLSSSSATLSLVRSSLSLQLEKLLTFGSPASPQSVDEEIERFVEGCVGRLLQQRTAQIQEASASVVKAQDTEMSGAVLCPTWFQKWVPPHVASTAAKPLVTCLRQGTKPELADEERSLMRRLRDHQCRQLQNPRTESCAATEDAPQALRRSPRKSTQRSHSRASPKKSPRKSPVKKDKRIVTVMGRTRSFTAPVNSRCAYIFKKSKEVVAQKKDDPDSPEKTSIQASQAQNGNAQVLMTDFQDISELVSHLEKVYVQGVEGERLSLSCAQYLINVALHYVKFTEQADPQISTVKLFHQHLLRTAADIRGKYDKHGGQSEEAKEDRVRELELQVILRLELHSLLLNDTTEGFDVDTVVQEVVTMLRSLSFLRDTGYLNQFLQDSLLHNYVPSIPRFLYLVYEELLQPLPPALLGFCSPQDDDNNVDSVQPPSNASSSFSEGMSCRSADLEQSRRSTRSRRSVASFTSFNMGRQITIPARAKKATNGAKEKEKMKTRSSAKKKSPKEETGPKCEMRKVRRNLFAGGGGLSVGSGTERRQSVAVMEGITEPPSTPPRRKRQGGKAVHTPKSHHILKTKTVLETPVHKQKGRSLWRKQEAIRRHTDTLTLVNVVQESPDKAVHEVSSEGAKKPSLCRRASLAMCRRKSFYSMAPENKSRNLEKYCQSKYNLLEARMAGKGTSPSSSQSQSQTQCRTTPPRRINPTMFSQLNTPSPPKSAIKRSLFSSSQSCSSGQLTPNKQLFSACSQPSPLVGSTHVTVTPTKTIVPRRAVKRIMLGSPLKPELNAGEENVRSPFRSPQTRGRSIAISPPDISSDVTSTSSPYKNSCVSSSRLDSPKNDMMGSPEQLKGLASSHGSGSDKENSPVFLESQSMDYQCLLSPRRSQRLTGSDTAGNVSPTLGAGNNAKLSTTPSHKRHAKKGCRTPETLDQWPRRKPRNLLYSPKSCPPLVAKDDAESLPGVELMDTDVPSSPELRRRIARKPRQCLLSSPLAGSRGSSLSSPVSRSQAKRKRDPEGDSEYSTLRSQSGTPHKKQRVSVTASPDYFSSQEVFIEAGSLASHSSISLSRHVSEASEGWHSPTRGLPPSDSQSWSWSLGSKPSEIESESQPQSPIFKQSLLKKHSSGLHSDLSNESEALPSSPVLRQRVDSLLGRLESDESINSNSGQPLHHSPVISPSGTKFSPVCARSLAHLMSSPLLSASSSDASSPTNHKGPRRGAKSRRSLMYRSQSQANIQ